MCPLAAAVAPTWEITLDEKVAQLSKRAMGDRITDGGRSQIIFAKVIDRQPVLTQMTFPAFNIVPVDLDLYVVLKPVKESGVPGNSILDHE